MSSPELPTLGSIWEHVESPGLEFQVLSLEHIDTPGGSQVYVHLNLALDEARAHMRAHISIDLDTLYSDYVCPATAHRPTQWERLLENELAKSSAF